jgi:hypothetical protein
LLSGHRTKNALVLAPSIWREVLRSELIASGFEQDTAGLIARRVIDRLVTSYLSGRVKAVAPTTHSLDEAA